MSVGSGTSSFHKHGIELDTEIPIVLHNLTQSYFCINIQKAWCLGFWIGRDSVKWLPVYSDQLHFEVVLKIRDLKFIQERVIADMLSELQV